MEYGFDKMFGEKTPSGHRQSIASAVSMEMALDDDDDGDDNVSMELAMEISDEGGNSDIDGNNV